MRVEDAGFRGQEAGVRVQGAGYFYAPDDPG